MKWRRRRLRKQRVSRRHLIDSIQESIDGVLKKYAHPSAIPFGQQLQAAMAEHFQAVQKFMVLFNETLVRINAKALHNREGKGK